MLEFCQFILNLSMFEWLKLMGTLLILGMIIAGILEEFGAKWGNKK